MAAISRTSIFDFLTRNAFLISGVAIFVAFWMLVYTFAVYRPSYAAKAMVIIKDSAITSRYVEPEQYYAMQTTSSSSSNPVLNTMGILKSQAISTALYKYFQNHHPEQLQKNRIKTKAEWDKFFGDGTGFIKAKNTPGTDLIAIQFSWSDRVIAKEALEVVVRAFQQASRDLNKEEQIRKSKFLAQQVGEIEEQLASIRRRKSEYQSSMHTVSLQREGSDLAASRMELANKLSQLEAQARGKENTAQRYQQMLGMTPERALNASALGQNATLTRLQDELYRLEQQYSLLSSSLTDTNPKVQEIRAQINQVRANIDMEKMRTMGKQGLEDRSTVVADATRNTLITSMLTAQSEAQDLRAQASVLRNRLQQIESMIQTFPEVAEGLVTIEQKEASLSLALDHLRQKSMEGRLKEEQTLSNVFIVDAPRLPDQSQFPTRNHLILLSLLLGLGSGLAIAFAKEQFAADLEVSLPSWLEPIDTDNTTAHPAPAYASVPQTEKRIGPVPRRPDVLYRPELLDTPREMAIPSSSSRFDALLPVSGPLLQPGTASAATAASSTETPDAIRQDLISALPQPQKEVGPATPPTRVRQAMPPQKLPQHSVRTTAPAAAANIPTLHAAETPEDTNTRQALPFSRRRGLLPAFLMEGDAPQNNAAQKSLLAPHDDLLQEVSPIGAPLDEAALSQRRRPLVSALMFGKQPQYNSEQRELNLPGSLKRSMLQALQETYEATGTHAG